MWRHVKFPFRVFPFLWQVEVSQVYLMAFILQSHFLPHWFMSCRKILWPVFLVSALLCAHSSWPRRWCDGWWQSLRRQSMSSAWNTGGQWGSLPVLARTLHLEWPWSSHLGLSERCHCQYREIWSLYLGKAEKIWGSQTLSSFTSFTAEVWKAMPRSVFWRGLLQNDLKLCSLKGAAKQADTQPDMLNHRTNEQQTRTNSL